MSQVATIDPSHAHAEPAESPLTPESWGKLGMWIFLSADAMSFGGLLAGYGALRYYSPNWPVPSQVLGISLTAFMTFLLIVSSFTMVKALSACRKGDRAGTKLYLLLTILGGASFLGMQAYEWTHLIHEGVTLSGNPFGSPLFGTTFFILTGFHGCHVLAGVLYLTCTLLQIGRGAWGYNEVEITGLYWHFVDLIWILVFTFVYLL
ncbi:MAG TPA: cytochrome c oxidase subunit 3 [Candidatus Polarisedimenticolia bacterium]|nr:cytochrome c oxidase subunit 3 [Candidatus Polarisedimenticolia bacterium]